jgi:hypothetical protein
MLIVAGTSLNDEHALDEIAERKPQVRSVDRGQLFDRLIES